MYALVYAEINIFCLIICIIILFRLKKSLEIKLSTRYYTRVVTALMPILVTDTIWILIDGKSFPLARELNLTVNLLFLFFCSYSSYRWLLYAMVKLDAERRPSGARLLAVSIPILALFVVCAATPWTGWMCSIGPDNFYQRGPVHILQVLVSYGYMLGATVLTLTRALREKSPYMRSDYLTLASFVLFPAVGATIQILVSPLPLVAPSITLGLLTVYIILQDRQITKDRLTGLNNRYDFNRHLFEKVTETKRRRELCLTMMDIDSFKRINDSYGHLEGDKALIRVADALKEACSGKNCYAARFGGDEFAVIWELDSEAPFDIEERIEAEMAQLNLESSSGYKLSLSIGTAHYNDELRPSSEQFIAEADKLLYAAKRKKKEIL